MCSSLQWNVQQNVIYFPYMLSGLLNGIVLIPLLLYTVIYYCNFILNILFVYIVFYWPPTIIFSTNGGIWSVQFLSAWKNFNAFVKNLVIQPGGTLPDTFIVMWSMEYQKFENIVVSGLCVMGPTQLAVQSQHAWWFQGRWCKLTLQNNIERTTNCNNI